VFECDAVLPETAEQRRESLMLSPGRFTLLERDTARSRSTSILPSFYAATATIERALPGILPREPFPVKQISGDNRCVDWPCLVNTEERNC